MNAAEQPEKRERASLPLVPMRPGCQPLPPWQDTFLQLPPINPTPLAGAALINISSTNLAYSVLTGPARTFSDGQITAGSNVISSVQANFTTADIGKCVAGNGIPYQRAFSVFVKSGSNIATATGAYFQLWDVGAPIVIGGTFKALILSVASNLASATLSSPANFTGQQPVLVNQVPQIVSVIPAISPSGTSSALLNQPAYLTATTALQVANCNLVILNASLLTWNNNSCGLNSNGAYFQPMNVPIGSPFPGGVYLASLLTTAGDGTGIYVGVVPTSSTVDLISLTGTSPQVVYLGYPLNVVFNPGTNIIQGAFNASMVGTVIQTSSSDPLNGAVITSVSSSVPGVATISKMIPSNYPTSGTIGIATGSMLAYPAQGSANNPVWWYDINSKLFPFPMPPAPGFWFLSKTSLSDAAGAPIYTGATYTGATGTDGLGNIFALGTNVTVGGLPASTPSPTIDGGSKW
jgi:hypothetical protein